MKNGIYRYEVTMSVPLGKRNGYLDIEISENKLLGFLTMFTEKLPILDGCCDGDSLTFTGNMKTLMDTFGYVANGVVHNDQINLLFRTNRGDYPAAGRRSVCLNGENCL